MGTIVGTAERVNAATNWSALREACGSAQHVGGALSDLLSAYSPEATEAPYWRIENHVFVQGELFECSEACVAVLVAALADARPRHVRICILDLLFLILSGAPSTLGETPPDIVERCQRVVREGRWDLVREAIVGERDAAWAVLELAGLGERLESLRQEIARARAVVDALPS